MAEVDDFLEAVLPTLREVETALHSGDAKPRFATWSHDNPVTVFGAVRNVQGWDDIAPAFEWLASSFSDCRSHDRDVIAAGASGDLAYLVSVEHTTCSIGGGPVEPYSLRVTLVFRREDGQWKVVHRHADPAPDGDAVREQLDRLSSRPVP
jgi:ketosteroid isomerase-like protein